MPVYPYVRLGVDVDVDVRVDVDVDVAVDVDVDVMCICTCILYILYRICAGTGECMCWAPLRKQNIEVPCSPICKIYNILYMTHGTLSTKRS